MGKSTSRMSHLRRCLLFVGVPALLLAWLVSWVCRYYYRCPPVRESTATFPDRTVRMQIVQGNQYYPCIPRCTISPDGRVISFAPINGSLQQIPGRFIGEMLCQYDRVTGKVSGTGAHVKDRFTLCGNLERHLVPRIDAQVSDNCGIVSWVKSYASASPMEEFDVFATDLTGGTTRKITVTPYGGQADGSCGRPAISGDGKVLAFISNSSNLLHSVPWARAKPSPVTDLLNHLVPAPKQLPGLTPYIVDRSGQHLSRIAVPKVNGLDPIDYTDLVMNRNGRFLAFIAHYESDHFEYWPRLMCYDRLTRRLTALGDKHVEFDSLSLSADGRYLTFVCPIALSPEDKSYSERAYIYDRQAKLTRRVSLDSHGTSARCPCYGSRISQDGRWVAFLSSADTFTPPPPPRRDTTGMIYSYDAPWVPKGWDVVYLRNLTTNTTTCLGNAEQQMKARLGLPHGCVESVSISASGRYICYAMYWSTISPYTADGLPDPGWDFVTAWTIHVYDRQTRQTTTPIIACTLTDPELAKARKAAATFGVRRPRVARMDTPNTGAALKSSRSDD